MHRYILHIYIQVKSWPKNQYGQFFNGDSYIILNTYKEEDSEVSGLIKLAFRLQ